MRHDLLYPSPENDAISRKMKAQAAFLPARFFIDSGHDFPIGRAGNGFSGGDPGRR